MGLDEWLGLAHVFSVVLWTGALAGCALRPAPPALVRAAAGFAAFGAIFTGVWLLHRAPSLLTMTHMHVKAAALVALGLLDHLVIRGTLRGPLTGRGVRVAAVAVVTLVVCAAALAGPEAA